MICPNQGQGGYVIMDGWLAHELLHPVDSGNAQRLRSPSGRLLQSAFYPVESKLLAPAPAFQ
jgi:hypothetical protein